MTQKADEKLGTEIEAATEKTLGIVSPARLEQPLPQLEERREQTGEAALEAAVPPYMGILERLCAQQPFPNFIAVRSVDRQRLEGVAGQISSERWAEMLGSFSAPLPEFLRNRRGESDFAWLLKLLYENGGQYYMNAGGWERFLSATDYGQSSQVAKELAALDPDFAKEIDGKIKSLDARINVVDKQLGAYEGKNEFPNSDMLQSITSLWLSSVGGSTCLESVSGCLQLLRVPFEFNLVLPNDATGRLLVGDSAMLAPATELQRRFYDVTFKVYAENKELVERYWVNGERGNELNLAYREAEKPYRKEVMDIAIAARDLMLQNRKFLEGLLPG